MQFIANGPEVPDQLIHSHEEGRVVFFCGAGVSLPAGMKSFKGLVDQLIQKLHLEGDPLREASGQLDTAIGLLERSVHGRAGVRREIQKILKVDDPDEKALATHRALLALGNARDGRTRLITTNFDRLFEAVIAADKLPVRTFVAPLLPLPKSLWNGLVYLHGLLPGADENEDALDQLVVSSGDFGLAYLTERWAARFASELFRNYTVCFVGYSLDDPILRYMMDALAADRLRGEDFHTVYAFAAYCETNKEQKEKEWLAKNVVPILYDKHNKHKQLHGTLQEWAAIYRDGIEGKKQVIERCARLDPKQSTSADDFVGRVLWALSDATGGPAKYFAEMTPAPSLAWLEPLSAKRFGSHDLQRFGIMPAKGKPVESKQREFSLLSRPSPYMLAPPMALTNQQVNCGHWDLVMGHLAPWLLRHLDDPELIVWLSRQSGSLHERFVIEIESFLRSIDRFQREENTDALLERERISPAAIPGPAMRRLWGLMLRSKVGYNKDEHDPYSWAQHVKQEGLSYSLLLELLDFLEPRVALALPTLRLGGKPVRRKAESINGLVSRSIRLAGEEIAFAVQELMERTDWKASLSPLVHAFDTRLREVMALMQELDLEVVERDPTDHYLPSICRHEQNQEGGGWVVLVELLRDAWLGLAKKSPEQAEHMAHLWWLAPYPLFKRLALFAASHEEVIPHATALEWLEAENGKWLWAFATRREAMRLLISLSERIDQKGMDALDELIRNGPPDEIFRSGIDADRLKEVRDREVWFRLTRLHAKSLPGSTVRSTSLEDLATHYPEWPREPDERDEFSSWFQFSAVKDETPATPKRRRDLVYHLKQHPDSNGRHIDDWPDRCVSDFPVVAATLCVLAQEGNYPIARWKDALFAWMNDSVKEQAWRRMAPLVASIFERHPEELADAVSWWLDAVGGVFQGHEDLFFSMADRVLKKDHGAANSRRGANQLFDAMNHPVGRVAQAVLDWWYRQDLKDEMGLDEKVKPMFSAFCSTDNEKLWPARILLARNAIALFRVGPEWAMEYLLPLFSWTGPSGKASAVWQGFLSSPRLHPSFMQLVKDDLLATAGHYNELGEFGREYAFMLTHVGHGYKEIFTETELRDALAALPADGLELVAQTLVQTLRGSEQREAYWENRVAAFIRSAWPVEKARNSASIAESFAELSIHARGMFTQAFQLLKPWIDNPARPAKLVGQLEHSGLCRQFPKCALAFLDSVTGDSPIWDKTTLADCLNAIQEAQPALGQDLQFKRLHSLTE